MCSEFTGSLGTFSCGKRFLSGIPRKRTAMLERFTIAIPNNVLEDLHARLAATRLPRGLTHDDAKDWSAGTNPSYLHELIDYWRDHFDWRMQEALLNRFNQFLVTVDGTKLHVIHEKGRGRAPLPIILTHGYPDSFFRFFKLIPLLTDPAAHGGDAAVEVQRTA